MTLRNFRNYRKADFAFPERTVIVGPNAAGKTNLLEAAFLFSAGKSFRAGRESEMVSWGESQARVEATFAGGPSITRHKAAITLDASGRVIKKSFELDGKARPTKELRRRFPMVLFSAEDRRLVDGSPGRRRRTLDLILGQGAAAYQEALAKFNRALASRNRLLEQIAARESTEAELDVWDVQLAEAGDRVIAGRMEFFAASAAALQQAYDSLTKRSGHARGRLSIAYEPIADFEALLGSRRGQDIAVGTTTAGPHRDDWTILLDGRALNSFGSGGEFRSAALAWRLAETAWLAKITEREPILLLDDVFSELDAARAESLQGALPAGQTIITTPEASEVPDSLRQGAEVIEISPKERTDGQHEKPAKERPNA
ncbi:MAG: DNA replication and repair protein RecF [bacterium]|nr:DNA replication and repair protein RecF [bacterium]